MSLGISIALAWMLTTPADVWPGVFQGTIIPVIVRVSTLTSAAVIQLSGEDGSVLIM